MKTKSKKQKQSQKEERLEKRNKFFPLLIILLFWTSSLAAQSTFEFTEKCVEAQHMNLEARIYPARAILERQADSFPKNSAIAYLLQFNYFVEAFISEEESKIKAFEKKAAHAIDAIETLSDTNRFKKFALAETYFYKAVIKGKNDNLMSAAKDVSKAHDYIKSNAKTFPDFLLNNKTLGIMKVYLAALPDNYKWATNLLGFKGDLSQGLSLLKKLSRSMDDSPGHAAISKEASYYYSFALYHVANRPNTAWLETLKATADYKSNNLSAFFRSNMALKMQKNEMAIAALIERPDNSDYLPFYFLDYQLGVAKLHRMDIDAVEYFNRFKDNFKGKSYMKSCYQKMSWYYLLAGDYKQFNRYKQDIKSVGKKLAEEDKQAEHYSSKAMPDRVLLKARLQCDGGYYTNALKTIKKVDKDKLKNLSEKSEYCYRKGKIFEHLGETEIAMTFYEASSVYGINSPEYYAAYASIYLGDNALANGDKEKARSFYKRALSYEDNLEYRESIEQRAKSGIRKAK